CRVEGTGAYRKPAALAAHAGAVYTVAGSSGVAGGGTLDYPAMFISLNVMGSLVLDINDGRLDAQFVDNHGLVQDHFTILKTMTPPVINSVTPASGIVGSAVTIGGSGFGTTAATGAVRFNGTLATPTSWSGTSLVVPVPTGATSGPIVVTVNGTPSNAAA